MHLNGLNAIDRFQSNIKYPQAIQSVNLNQTCSEIKLFIICLLAKNVVTPFPFASVHTIHRQYHIDTSFEIHCQGDAIFFQAQ